MMMLSNIGQMISIHALREEGDCSFDDGTPCRCTISIHALREEGDLPRFFWTEAGALYFYPRPP